MNKKKVSALLIAGILSIGAIGGTLAWFTSQDSVTNAFQTGSIDNPGNTDGGINIEENFEKNDAENMTPGDEVTKEVSVTITASYNQLIRAKIEKVWKDSKGNVVTHYIISEGKAKDKQGSDVTVPTIQYLNLTEEEASSTDGAQSLDKNLIILNLDKDKWINNSDIIKRQVMSSKGVKNYKGFAVFRYQYMFEIFDNDNLAKEVSGLREVIKDY